MNNIFYFAFVGIIVVVSLYIILKILIKKFQDWKDTKIGGPNE